MMRCAIGKAACGLREDRRDRQRAEAAGCHRVDLDIDGEHAVVIVHR
jgi:hypothetical protein